MRSWASDEILKSHSSLRRARLTIRLSPLVDLPSPTGLQCIEAGCRCAHPHAPQLASTRAQKAWRVMIPSSCIVHSDERSWRSGVRS
eukprot:3305359-Alexandrium_andersonii.AAC.1